jgi:phosphoribosyl-ATP pyrophosphohydrolase/phosphoribosyl-AMP cyclohydrolase
MNQARAPKFETDDSLLPAIVQDDRTGKVLMLGYMNSAAFAQTNQSGLVTFFSRSKNRLWVKGESSGNQLKVRSVAVDCDGDTILVRAEPTGPICHTGDATCFQESNEVGAEYLGVLERLIARRRAERPAGSYVVSLLDAGDKKIAQKVGEEAAEVVIEAVSRDRDRLIEESADLLFHFLVLLGSQDVRLADVAGVLEQRNRGG